MAARGQLECGVPRAHKFLHRRVVGDGQLRRTALLDLSPGVHQFELGAFNGAYQAIAVVAALGGAWFTDRHRRYKEVAGVGYAASAASRVGLVAARSAWLPATVLLYTDRVAKGLRTAPRDALISISAVRRHLGEAFGLHRTFDTAGALAGPVVAFLVLSAAPGAYDTVFTTSFWIAVIGIAVFVLFVRNPPRLPTAFHEVRPRLHAGVELLRLRDFRRLVAAGTLLSLFTIGDALIYLTFQQRTSMSLRYFPLLFAGTAGVYTLLALPMGRLADRIRPARVYLCGQLLVILVDVILLIADPGPLALVVMLAALGVYYATTDGVLAALASSLLPTEVRTTGLAVLGSAIGLAQFAASLAFGALWGLEGPNVAVTVFLVGFAIGIVVAVVLLRSLTQRATPEVLAPSS